MLLGLDHSSLQAVSLMCSRPGAQCQRPHKYCPEPKVNVLLIVSKVAFLSTAVVTGTGPNNYATSN